MNVNYDLLVIGAGSGGIAAANRAAAYGQKVAIFEPDQLGGTCVNAGCIPKKLMWYAAQTAHGIHQADAYGFDIDLKDFSWSTLAENRRLFLQRLRGHYQRGLENNGVRHIAETARFIDNLTLEAAGTRYMALNIIIATGGNPRLPELPGAGLGMTSDDIFDLDTQPRRIAIAGAGYIAVEFACLLRALGSEVTLLLRKNRPIRGFDQMLQDRLMQAMLDQGINVQTNSPVSAVHQSNAGLSVESGEQSYEVDSLLWAIGRSANTASLDLDQTAIRLDAAGYIETDSYQNTSAPGVYAVGDVTGQAELTPVAIAAGRRLADRLFNNMPDRCVDYRNIPTVIFTHPPVASIGLTESDARAQFGAQVKVYNSVFTPLENALTAQKIQSSMKLVVSGAEEKIVGCHVFGPGADEMMQGFAVAIRMGARKRDFDDTIAIHPTSAEELVTMR